MNWDDLRLLLAIANHGSFLKASTELGVVPSTLSRRLTQLENDTKMLLVERSVDGCVLTEQGRQFSKLAKNMSANLDKTFSALSNPADNLGGTIKLSAGDGFVQILTIIIKKFAAHNPNCIVEFGIEADYRDIAGSEIDVAIRTQHKGEPSLMYKRLSSVQFGVFCSKGYLQSLPASPEPVDLDMIGMLPPFSEAAHMRVARAAGFSQSKLKVSSVSAQIQAVEAAMGAAILPRALAPHLVEIFPNAKLPKLDVYLVTRPQALRQPHIRAFVDIVYAEFAKMNDL